VALPFTSVLLSGFVPMLRPVPTPVLTELPDEGALTPALPEVPTPPTLPAPLAPAPVPAPAAPPAPPPPAAKAELANPIEIIATITDLLTRITSLRFLKEV
jgi:hypothetical protein